jgi:multimeric flavodoxin WrbA
LPKNILVLTGSPRKGGNSDLLADAFIQGAKQSGHTVVKFEAAMKNIKGCRACDTCWSKDTACSMKGDFTALEPLLEQAEVIVFCSPIYWCNYSSQLKAVLDRLYAYFQPQCRRTLKIKESVLMICGEDENGGSFSPAIDSYKSISDYCNWQERGVLAVPAVHKKGDILKTDALKKAEDLGKRI